MPFPSPFKPLAIPQCNIFSHLFADGRSTETEPIWIDAGDPSQTLSLSQAHNLARRFAVGLDDLEIPTGSVVMLFAPNNIYIPAIYLAITGSKRIFTGANPGFTLQEVSDMMKLVNPTMLLVHPSRLETALAAARENGIPETHIFLLSDTHCETHHAVKDWRSILASEEAGEKWICDPLEGPAAAETIAAINWSGGTTGLPKGVCISHANVVSNIQQVLVAYFEGKVTSEQNPGTEKWLIFLPLYHAFGQAVAIAWAARLRYKVYVLSQFTLEDFLRCIERYKITELHVAAPVLTMLDKSEAVKNYDLSSVKEMIAGAAPLSAALRNGVSEKFKAQIDVGYGLTEVTMGVIGSAFGEQQDLDGSVGLLIPNTEVKLVDDEGKELLEEGETGELLVKGPQVTMGYWKNPIATEAAFDSEGFFRTGDVLLWRRDQRGRMKWYTVDRKKEIIKVGGLPVAPAELEAVLIQCPYVADAAVVGILTEDGGDERPRAYVVLQESAKRDGRVGEREIKQFVEERLAQYKWLEGGVKFVEVVPKLPTGKIMRKAMKELAKQDFEEMKRQTTGPAESANAAIPAN